jgi:hypothetical protein
MHARSAPNEVEDEFDEIWTMSTRGTRARRIFSRNAGWAEEDNSLNTTLSWQPFPR